jgi:hypothetical protein
VGRWERRDYNTYILGQKVASMKPGGAVYPKNPTPWGTKQAKKTTSGNKMQHD